MKKLFLFFVLILGLLLGSFYLTFAAQSPQELSNGNVCAVYFTGVGCPHCARTDPVVLESLLEKYPNFVVIEYEVYQKKGNAYIIGEYNDNYHFGLGIPLIIFDREKYLVGDDPILENIEEGINGTKNNTCLLADGSSKDFQNLDLTNLPGQPKIWRDSRILIKTGENNEWIFAWNGPSLEKKNSLNPNKKDILQKLILENNIPGLLKNINYKSLGSFSAPLSGRKVTFENAVEIKVGSKEAVPATKEKLTLPKLLLLAITDSVNPCALAVLLLVLVAILAYNPEKKRDVLLAGLAFVFSIFIMYFLYGLIIIKFFQIVQSLALFRLWLYKALGVIAIILGILNIRDFISYKPGGLMTEMPLSWRPKAKKIISGITSPKGAFGIGIFVTLFLLPCTMGPYFIAGGILSVTFMEIMKVIPWLLLYNLIFVLPMLAIVIVVYSGFKKVEDIHGWKDKNIKYLHLVAGLIMVILGIIMVLSLF